MRKSCSRGSGFTLVELLVVIMIISALIGLALPMMSLAREAAKSVVCSSNIRQMGLSVTSYATDYRNRIPQGPLDIRTGSASWAEMAESQIWVDNLSSWNASGLILRHYLQDPAGLFCPGEDSIGFIDTQQPRLSGQGDPTAGSDIFCSYAFRQLDQTTKPMIEDLGYNDMGNPARALIWDRQHTDPNNVRVTHKALTVNIGYTDGHVDSYNNKDGPFSITASDETDLATYETRLDQIIIGADWVETNDVTTIPTAGATPN